MSPELPRTTRSTIPLLLLFLTLLLSTIPSFAQDGVLPLPADPSGQTPAANSDCVHVLGPWKRAAPAPANHVEGGHAVVNGKMYLFTGFANNNLVPSNRVDVYNPATDVWESIAMPRKPVPLAASHIQAVAHGTDIWIVGGFIGQHPGTPTRQVWRYDTVGDQWYEGPKLPKGERRASAGTVLRGSILHVFGGLSDDRQTDQADHWTLDLTNPVAWETAPDLPQPRNHLNGITLKGEVYAVGGQFGHDVSYQDVGLVHAFDPDTNQWSQKASLPIPRSHFEAAVFKMNGRMIVIGGRTTGNEVVTNVTEYHPETDVWTDLRPLPTKLIGPSAAYINGKIVVTVGGYDYNQGQRDTFVSNVTLDCSGSEPRDPVTQLAPKWNETVSYSAYPFQWSEDPQATKYKVKVRAVKSSSFRAKAKVGGEGCTSGICSLSLDYDPVLPNHTAVEWMVVAKDSAKNKTKTSWQQYLTEMPGSPDLYSPENNSTLSDNNPTFSWDAIGTASQIKLVIKSLDKSQKIKFKFTASSTPSLNDICDGDTCSVALSDIPGDLRANTTYKWKVKPRSEDGRSKSEAWRFTSAP